MALLESEETWNQTFLRGFGQRWKGVFEIRDRANWESLKGLFLAYSRWDKLGALELGMEDDTVNLIGV